MRTGLNIAAAVLTLLAAGPAAAQTSAVPEPTMGWPEAVELLQRERLSAEVCARVTKRYLPAGDPDALRDAELEYEAARAEFNGVIAGLQAALIQGEEEPALETVEARTTTGTEARRAFCDKAKAMEPPPEPGERGVIEEVVSGTVGAVIEAAVTIWSKLHDADDLRRANLRTALEDAKWPAFASIDAAP